MARVFFSEAAGKVAVIAKTCRNACNYFVVLGYALYWSSKGQAASVGNKAAFLWKKFPLFVLGFFVLSILATANVFSKSGLVALANLSRWAFLLTFAGVGMRTDLHKLFQQGTRPFLVGAIGEVAIAIITLGLVYGADRWIHL